MKTIYSSAFFYFLLVGFSAWAQMTAPTLPTLGSAAPITVSAAAGVPLGVLTNGVLPPTLTWLPDEPSDATDPSLPATPAFSVQEESTNGLPVVRFIYQSSPATIAAT